MKFTQTATTGGDETAPYDVSDYQAKTIVEFIHEVLAQSPNEWGYIEVKDGPACEEFHWRTRIEYRYGELLNDIPEAWLYRKIVSVTAAGGWSRMDYLITPSRHQIGFADTAHAWNLARKINKEPEQAK